MAQLHRLVGTHRIKRVPSTEKQGRRHTSTVVVSIPGETSTTPTRIDPSQVREEFIRTTGKGGQNRNKVSSCVRLTHLPTGLQVVADTQRHQAQNRKIAWARLRALLAEQARATSFAAANASRREAWQSETYRQWVWTGWRDEVRLPSGTTLSMSRLLNGGWKHALA